MPGASCGPSCGEGWCWPRSASSVGCGLALGASRAVEGLVFGVSPWKPGLVVLVATLMAAVGIVGAVRFPPGGPRGWIRSWRSEPSNGGGAKGPSDDSW